MDVDLPRLVDSYVRLERRIQHLIAPVTRRFCPQCDGSCCREEICRESMTSPFLSMLVLRQNLPYSRRGWQGSSGCRLAYGRPLVCYDFFCENILTSPWFKAAGIQGIIQDFVSIGDKARGNTHLICIDDPGILTTVKIEKMSRRIHALIERLR